jgi:hypothetical protein
MRFRAIRSLAVLLPLLAAAGCSDALVGPEESLELSADAQFFMAEVSVSMNAAPQERAAAAVAHAKAVLERATETLRGRPGVSADVLALLAEAARGCAEADARLAAGELRGAVHAAMVCVNLSRESILRAQAERRAEVRDRASQAIADAEALVASAAARVASGAPEQAQVLLVRAQEELGRARVAFEDARWGEAIARAARAGAAAQRILIVLR